MIKPRIYSLFSLVVLILIITLGFANRVIPKPFVEWTEGPLTWPDFVEVDYLFDDFDAAIYSEIYYPEKITPSSPRVYAYMDPNLSERVKDTSPAKQLLIHEQYHFHITEYYARLLRKAIIETGKENISKKKMKTLYTSFETQRDSLQTVYDRESDHNVEQQKQRFWELKIDDLLRRTAYYSDTNILNYHEFSKDSTTFFRRLYATLDNTLLPSYPITKAAAQKGLAYQLIEMGDTTVVKYFKNGAMVNGGEFETAIAVLTYQENEVEVQYRNADSTFNTQRDFSVLKTSWDEKGNITSQYYDEARKRISKKGIYTTRFEAKRNNMFFYSYLDENGNLVSNGKGIYHKNAQVDSLGRVLKIELLDKNNERINDDEFVAIYALTFDENNNIITYKLYDQSGEYATHLTSYNKKFLYDLWGNINESINLNENDQKVDDAEGVCTYKYTYDIYNNIVSTRKYNNVDKAILGLDDYFQSISDYDSLNRISFVANYYPGYVLYFDDDKWGATQYEYPNDSKIIKRNLDVYNGRYNSDTGVGAITSYLNKKGQVKESIYQDYSMSFARTAGDVVIYQYKYDERGNTIEESTLDSLGNLIAFEHDVAIVKREYDTRNNKVKTTYFTAEDKLAKGNQNVTYSVYNYNDTNILAGQSNYNAQHKPQELDGVFKTKFEINRFGKDSIINYYNASGRLIRGVCTIRYKYNSYGSLLEEASYNSSGKLITGYTGVAMIKYNYNKKQQSLGYENYDTNDKPTNDINGVFAERKHLNDSGYVTLHAYFNKENEPMIGPEGYHKVIFEWNVAGEVIKRTTYGNEGRLLEDIEGVAQYNYTRYPSGLIKSVRYYDKNLHLTEDSDGVAVYKYKEYLNGLYYTDRRLDKNENDLIEEEILEEETLDQETLEEVINVTPSTPLSPSSDE